MQCTEIEKLIDPLVDNEISSLLRNDVERHIDDCMACGEYYANAKYIRRSLRAALPTVAPSDEVDAFVRNVFHRTHKRIEVEKKGPTRTGIFPQVFIPRPVGAVSFVVLVALLGMAFELGRMWASHADSSIPDMSATPAPTQLVERPVFIEKTVEVPIVKEKVVRRILYSNGKSHRNVGKDRRIDRLPVNDILNSSVAENGYLTQTSLKGFQPVSKIKPTIIRGDKNHEK